MIQKALSLWQPWGAALFVPELKPIETRGWYTGYRGKLVIHSAKAWSLDQRQYWQARMDDSYICNAFEKAYGPDDKKWLTFGALLGTVDLIDCIRTSPLAARFEEDNLTVATKMNEHIFAKFCVKNPEAWPMCCSWGDFSPGRFGHVYANPVLFPEPIPYKGAQGFFNVELNPQPSTTNEQ